MAIFGQSGGLDFNEKTAYRYNEGFQGYNIKLLIFDC